MAVLPGRNGSLWPRECSSGASDFFPARSGPARSHHEFSLMAGQRPFPTGAVLRLKSAFRLLRHLQGIVYLDAQVADGALQLGMAQEQLHGAQILGPAVDQRGLGAA